MFVYASFTKHHLENRKPYAPTSPFSVALYVGLHVCLMRMPYAPMREHILPSENTVYHKPCVHAFCSHLTPELFITAVEASEVTRVRWHLCGPQVTIERVLLER